MAPTAAHWSQLLVAVVLQDMFGSACGRHDPDAAVLSNEVTKPLPPPAEALPGVSQTRRRPYLGSWEYSGCGNQPCPGGTKLDIAPDPWTAQDYVVETRDGPRPWQTLIFTVRPLREVNAK